MPGKKGSLKIGDRDARQVVREFLGHVQRAEGEGSAEFQARRASAVDSAHALVRGSMSQALKVVQQHDEAGLTVRGAADVVDELVGMFEDPEEARAVLRNHLTDERRVELLSARGDLPSSAVTVAEADDVFGAMLEDVSKAPKDLCSFLIRSWAMKLIDREDYRDFLDRAIGPYTIRQYILMAIWYDQMCLFVSGEYPDGEDRYVVRDDPVDGSLLPEEVDEESYHQPSEDPVEEIPLSVFDEYGLNAVESRDELRELLEADAMPEMDPEEIAIARQALTKRHKELESEATLVDVTRAEAEDDADDLEM